MFANVGPNLSKIWAMLVNIGPKSVKFGRRKAKLWSDCVAKFDRCPSMSAEVCTQVSAINVGPSLATVGPKLTGSRLKLVVEQMTSVGPQTSGTRVAHAQHVSDDALPERF